MVASISAVSSASAASSYYGKDNYYARGSGDPEPSAWAGRGAVRLGLTGPVDIRTLERVLSGETLDGKRVGQRAGESFDKAGERPHRPGFDLTLSPPKDVSLLLYLGGDQRIIHAHRAAVDKTLKWAERNMAGTRIRTGKGQVGAVKTGNLAIAKFEHDISREKDPQLHTHAVIANMTYAQGKWRALHNDPFFQHRKTLSLAYDAEMRNAMRGLGYGVVLENGKSGAYRIKGVPGNAVEEFSRGRARIDRAAETLDHDTPRARDVLAVKTRPTKTEMSQTERRSAWEARGAPWRAALTALAETARERQQSGQMDRPLDEQKVDPQGFEGLLKRFAQNHFRPTRTQRLEANDPYRMERGGSERDYAARAAVSVALRHLEEREAAFSLHHVRRAALEHAADGVTLKDVDRELRLLRGSRKVMTRANDPIAETTTKRALAHETRTLDLIRSAGASPPLVSKLALQDRLEGTTLTPGQRAAIETILAGDQRLVGVQGYAGTGKTTMMRNAADLARDLGSEVGKAGYELMGLTPTHSARKTLEQSGGIETLTVAGFLKDAKSGQTPKGMDRKIVLVDESSFLSTKSMNLILAQLEALKPARIVLSGDRRQHGAVEAGRPFDQAQRAGMVTAVMKDIVRLPKDAAHADQRAAVEAAARGHVMAAIKRLDANIIEDNANPARAAAEAWSRLDKTRQADALIVAPGHRLRGAINTEIRARMIQDGRLSQAATTIPIRQTQDLTRAEAASPRSYAPGDRLAFHARLDALNIKAGGVRDVLAIDAARGQITVRNSKGRVQTVSLETLQGRRDGPGFSVFREESLELRRGDRLMFTRSNKDQDIAATDTAKVVGFDETTITLDRGEATQTFERGDPALSALTHAYAVTSHASQGQTARDVVAVMSAADRKLTNQVGFYVSISRSADTLALVVDDKQAIMRTMLQQSGLKASALDAKARMETLTGLNQPPVGDAVEKGSEMSPTDASEIDRSSDRKPESGSEAGDEPTMPNSDQELGMDRDMDLSL